MRASLKLMALQRERDKKEIVKTKLRETTSWRHQRKPRTDSSWLDDCFHINIFTVIGKGPGITSSSTIKLQGEKQKQITAYNQTNMVMRVFHTGLLLIFVCLFIDVTVPTVPEPDWKSRPIL